MEPKYLYPLACESLLLPLGILYSFTAKTYTHLTQLSGKIDMLVELYAAVTNRQLHFVKKLKTKIKGTLHYKKYIPSLPQT